MDGQQLSHIVINAPVPVNFCGLQGTTMSMQANGWQLSVETYANYTGPTGYDLRIAGKHTGLGLRVLSYPTFFTVREMLQSGNHIPNIAFNIHVCAEQVMMRVDEVPKFKPIDFSKPNYMEVTNDMIGRELSLDECCIFKPMNEEVDIYVPEEKIWTVMEHLNAVTDMQKEKQAYLRGKAITARDRQERMLKASDRSAEGGSEHKEIKLQLIAVS